MLGMNETLCIIGGMKKIKGAMGETGNPLCIGELKIPNSKGRDCKSRPAHTSFQTDDEDPRPAGYTHCF